MGALELVRLARLIGREDFERELEHDPETATELDAVDRERLFALVNERIPVIGDALVEEAAASDDVIDSVSAMQFATDQLRQLDDLLTEDQRGAILTHFENATLTWDSE